MFRASYPRVQKRLTRPQTLAALSGEPERGSKELVFQSIELAVASHRADEMLPLATGVAAQMVRHGTRATFSLTLAASRLDQKEQHDLAKGRFCWS